MVRRVSIALSFAVLALASTACGVRSTIDPVAGAATKTEQAGGVDVALSASFGTSAKTVTMTGHGSFEQGQGELELDLGNLLPQSGALGSASTTMREIFLTEDGDPVIYLDFPLVSSMLGGKTWMRLDLQKAGKAMGVDMNELLKGSGQNPAEALALLKSAGNFTEVGKDTIGGAETTHYRGTLDVQEIAKERHLPDGLVQGLSASGAPPEVPYDVWVDDQGLVRQIVESYDSTIGGITTTYRVTIGLGNYGRDVSVTAPPSDQVFDVTGLASNAASQLGATH